MIKHLILPKYDGYLRGLALIVYKFFDKKVSNTHRGTRIDSDVVSKRKRPSDVAEEWHKQSIRFEKQKVRSVFKDNIDAPSVFIVNMRGLFLGKTKKVFQLLMLFGKS